MIRVESSSNHKTAAPIEPYLNPATLCLSWTLRFCRPGYGHLNKPFHLRAPQPLLPLIELPHTQIALTARYRRALSTLILFRNQRTLLRPRLRTDLPHLITVLAHSQPDKMAFTYCSRFSAENVADIGIVATEESAPTGIYGRPENRRNPGGQRGEGANRDTLRMCAESPARSTMLRHHRSLHDGTTEACHCERILRPCILRGALNFRQIVDERQSSCRSSVLLLLAQHSELVRLPADIHLMRRGVHGKERTAHRKRRADRIRLSVDN